MSFSEPAKYILGIILLLMIAPEYALAQLDVSGEFRPRTELRDGYKRLSTTQDDPAFFTSQRSRLTLQYQSDKYIFNVSGQDVRTWGDTEQLGDTPNFNIHEAWANVEVAEGLQLKLGRQELIYDDQRLLGSVNWAQQARSHDALLLMYQEPSLDLKVNLGLAYNQEGQNILGNTYTLNNYKTLSYAWINKQLGKLDASALFLSDGFELPSGSVNYRYTYGTDLTYKNNDWEASGTFYVQNGDDALRRNIAAYMAAGRLSYQWDPIAISVGYDYLSGGSASDSNPDRHSFNTLYATNHKFYGNMDYFTNIPNDTRAGGLQDVYVKTDFVLSEKLKMNLTYHHFALANSVSSPVPNQQTVNRNLGSELDYSLALDIDEDITFSIGYSALLESNNLEDLQLRQADGLQQWGWAMLVLTPNM